ncbi:MAG: type 4a pilus biogenesis protein PilO [Oceanicoccus sp.]|uniref:type 4a pilus biogenesis protein PilO n=1 Tax=Oceanicoccus sp. TaxID=2691044 RepID=UPI0026028D36|nr:type 4a pilus biogenesis protein PilO [Oceanicoccus sp.]MCP3908556.1 type 4a pilus biogenesis protein PilO [Oceanicoccus sp.]MDG1772993.1 type 4a pilus biogenesis protein PilO [Oceanicoccus sp.]
MSFNDAIQELKDFDVNDLDLENVGSWPIMIKTIVWVAVFIGVLAAGYFYDVADLQNELAKSEKKEQDLKSQFERKAFQAANLKAYRKQMEEMEESFGALISQLPSDTEVPGLLEDITNKGLASGLEISSITLGNERAEEFYIELPIQIEVSGNYHDLGSFVSGIAGLPRIVTLHDFQIAKQKDSSALTMKITAKTYRYKDLEVDDA